MLRTFSILLALGISLGAQTDPALLQIGPALLQIRVVEGEGLVYPLGSRATRGITVQVSDETGKPVSGASVSFLLPETGPSGTFSTGAKTEIATTRVDGRATVWGMQWNRNAGSFEIRVTAAKGQARAGTVSLQYLSATPAARDTGGGPSGSGPNKVGGHSHKWVWIVLAVAGAAGGGVAATGIAGKPPGSSPASAAVNGIKIGAPTVSLGHP